MRVMRELQSVAAGKGIKAGQFLPDMEQFGQQVYQARSGMGGLAEVLRANGVPAAKDFEDAFNKVADLIARAKDDQTRLSLLQQVGLPANMQYVRLMQQGADGIKTAREEAVKFNDAAEEGMIASVRRFDEAWDRFWDKFGKGVKSATVSAGTWLDELSDKVNELIIRFDVATGGTGRSALSLIYGAAVQQGEASRLTQGDAQKFYAGTGLRQAPFEPVATTAPNQRLRITVNRPTGDVDPTKQKADASRYLQMIGLLGQTATVTEQVTAFEKQLQLAWLTTGVSIPKERTAVIKKMIEEQALGITQIKASADAQRLEADVIGMTVGQSTAYLAVQNAILDAKRRGQPIREEDIARIEREAAALGAAAQRTDNLKSSYDIAKGAFTTFRQEIAQGTGVWDALGKAGINALDKIGAKLGDLAFDQAWQMFFGSGGSASSGGSGGGIFASIGKWLGFDRGGYTGDGGRQAVAGVVHGKEFVVNAQATARHRPLLEALNENRLPGYESGGYVSPPPSNVVPFTGSSQGVASNPATAPSITFSIDARGAQKGVGEEVAETLAAFVKSPAFARRVWDATKEGQAYRWS